MYKTIIIIICSAQFSVFPFVHILCLTSDYKVSNFAKQCNRECCERVQTDGMTMETGSIPGLGLKVMNVSLEI